MQTNIGIRLYILLNFGRNMYALLITIITTTRPNRLSLFERAPSSANSPHRRLSLAVPLPFFATAVFSRPLLFWLDQTEGVGGDACGKSGNGGGGGGGGGGRQSDATRRRVESKPRRASTVEEQSGASECFALPASPPTCPLTHLPAEQGSACDAQAADRQHGGYKAEGQGREGGTQQQEKKNRNQTDDNKSSSGSIGR
ncbi:hypothetical protein BKA80DRAFT_47689 [Phyllosticta citrichinensis]